MKQREVLGAPMLSTVEKKRIVKATRNAKVRRAVSKVLRHGRRKPYTQTGIRRLPCVKCGKPSEHTWQACADNNLYRPICLVCDVELNYMVLRWMGDPDAESKVNKYEDKVFAESRVEEI